MSTATLPAKHAAFDAWMNDNHPLLRVYAKAYADKFLSRAESGVNSYRQAELISETGVPMDVARSMVSAILRIYITGHVR